MSTQIGLPDMARTVQMHFRATEQEVAKIKQLAGQLDYTVSEYIRLVSLGLQVNTQHTQEQENV